MKQVGIPNDDFSTNGSNSLQDTGSIRMSNATSLYSPRPRGAIGQKIENRIVSKINQYSSGFSGAIKRGLSKILSAIQGSGSSALLVFFSQIGGLFLSLLAGIDLKIHPQYAQESGSSQDSSDENEPSEPSESENEPSELNNVSGSDDETSDITNDNSGENSHDAENTSDPDKETGISDYSESENVNNTENANIFYEKFNNASENARNIFNNTPYAGLANRSGMSDRQFKFTNSVLNAAIITDKFNSMLPEIDKNTLRDALPKDVQAIVNNNGVGDIDDARLEEANNILNAFILDENIKNTPEDVRRLFFSEQEYDLSEFDPYVYEQQISDSELQSISGSLNAYKLKNLYLENVKYPGVVFANLNFESDIIHILMDPKHGILSDEDYEKVSGQLRSQIIQCRIRAYGENFKTFIEEHQPISYLTKLGDQLSDSEFENASKAVKGALDAREFLEDFQKFSQNVQEIARNHSNEVLQKIVFDAEKNGIFDGSQKYDVHDKLNAIQVKCYLDELLSGTRSTYGLGSRYSDETQQKINTDIEKEVLNMLKDNPSSSSRKAYNIIAGKYGEVALKDREVDKIQSILGNDYYTAKDKIEEKTRENLSLKGMAQEALTRRRENKEEKSVQRVDQEPEQQVTKDDANATNEKIGLLDRMKNFFFRKNSPNK